MPHSRDRPNDEIVTIHLRTDAVIHRRRGAQKVSETRTNVYNMQIDIPVWHIRMLHMPERAVYEEVLQAIGDQFRRTGFVVNVAEKTADLLSEDI